MAFAAAPLGLEAQPGSAPEVESAALQAQDEPRAPEATNAENFNFIALPFENPSGFTSLDADGLADYVGASVSQVLSWNASSQQFEPWFPDFPLIGTNFPIGVGGSYFLLLDSTADSVVTFVGDVPAAGSVSFSLQPGGANCAFNSISIPLDHSIADADALATAIGGVEQVLNWDASAQQFQTWFPDFPLIGTNFPVETGHPYFLCLKSTAPTTWP
jgi:hypothetical protein